jgi:hypothetical protein
VFRELTLGEFADASFRRRKAISRKIRASDEEEHPRAARLSEEIQAGNQNAQGGR